MHEAFIAQKIIDKAEEQGKVQKIVLEVGDLAHLPAEDLEEALKKRVNWEIEIIKVPGEVQCKCGFKGAPKVLEKAHDLTLFECPKCKEIPTKIISGEDITIKEVVVE